MGFIYMLCNLYFLKRNSFDYGQPNLEVRRQKSHTKKRKGRFDEFVMVNKLQAVLHISDQILPIEFKADYHIQQDRKTEEKRS